MILRSAVTPVAIGCSVSSFTIAGSLGFEVSVETTDSSLFCSGSFSSSGDDGIIDSVTTEPGLPVVGLSIDSTVGIEFIEFFVRTFKISLIRSGIVCVIATSRSLPPTSLKSKVGRSLGVSDSIGADDATLVALYFLILVDFGSQYFLSEGTSGLFAFV